MAGRRVKLWLDKSTVNAAIASKFKSACDKNLPKVGTNMNNRIGHLTSMDDPSVYYRISPVTQAKALKNEAELEGMRSSHLR